MTIMDKQEQNITIIVRAINSLDIHKIFNESYK